MDYHNFLIILTNDYVTTKTITNIEILTTINFIIINFNFTKIKFTNQMKKTKKVDNITAAIIT